MTKEKRRRAVAEAFAEIAQMDKSGEGDPKDWDDLDDENRDDALRVADAMIRLVDALLAPLFERSS